MPKGSLPFFAPPPVLRSPTGVHFAARSAVSMETAVGDRYIAVSKGSLRFLDGGGEMGQRIRAFNWNLTPLGPPEDSPQALKTLVNLFLASKQPMFLGWGPERTSLYNDAFIPILGRKHPSALGQPSMAVWAEAREVLEPMFDRVFAGDPVSIEDFSLGLDRERPAKSIDDNEVAGFLQDLDHQHPNCRLHRSAHHRCGTTWGLERSSGGGGGARNATKSESAIRNRLCGECRYRTWPPRRRNAGDC